MKTIISHSEKETKNLGVELGKCCRGGEIFALSGALGSGKTCLAQGLAVGLGIKQRVNSPTFNIWKLYKIKAGRSAAKQAIKIFCHLDAYRLGSAKDLLRLGIEEYFGRADTVVAVEWAEKVRPIWPRGVKIIKMKNLAANRRAISIK